MKQEIINKIKSVVIQLGLLVITVMLIAWAISYLLELSEKQNIAGVPKEELKEWLKNELEILDIQYKGTNNKYINPCKQLEK